MLRVNPPSPRFTTTLFTLIMIATFSIPMLAQEAPAVHAGYTRITGLPDDWTHHHDVFSNPGTEEDAIKNGTHEQWLKIVNDPRYVLHELKRNQPVHGPSAEDVKLRYHEEAEDAEIHGKYDRDRRERRRHEDPAPKPTNAAIHRDWSMSVGSGGHLKAGQYPAKYNFSIASASCNDFVVFPTGLAGSGTQATIVAYNNIYATTCSGSVPSITWAYNTGETATLSPVMSYTGSQIAYVQMGTSFSTTLSAAITTVGQTAITVTSGTGIANGDYIQIGSEDMLVTAGGGTTGLTVTRAQLGTTAATHLNGTAVNRVAANLVLLRQNPTSGLTVGAPAAPTLVASGSYFGCTAPCYTTFPFAVSDTNSPPYYDYANDVMYVGSNGGILQKYTSVFNGIPTQATSGGWPVAVSGNVLTGPVFDAGSSLVFVGDSGGFLYSLTSTGTKVTSGQLAGTGSTGIVDAPLIDATTGGTSVYVFVGQDTSGLGGAGGVFKFATGFTGGNTGVEKSLGVGTASTTIINYDGAFDDIHNAGSGTTGSLYLCGGTSLASTTPSLYRIAMNAGFNGALSTIGTIASSAGSCSPVTEFLNAGSGGSAVTTLSAAITTVGQTAITVTSGTNIGTGDYIQVGTEDMKVTAGGGTTSLTVTRGALGTTAATHLSGASVLIPSLDWIYVSTTAGGSTTGCAGACIYNYYIGSTPAAAAAGLAATGGASGIIIDNSTTSAGESQIYYTTLSNQACVGNGTTGNGTGGCAVQASQSGLN